jgi:hypothetical protein
MVFTECFVSFVCVPFPLFTVCNYFNFQKYPTDRAYFIAKEILMTERTYKKDLEVISLVSCVKYWKE